MLFPSSLHPLSFLCIYSYFLHCVLTLHCVPLCEFTYLWSPPCIPPVFLAPHPCSCLILSRCVLCILIFRVVPSHLDGGAMNTEWGLLVSIVACPEGKSWLFLSLSLIQIEFPLCCTRKWWRLIFFSSSKKMANCQSFTKGAVFDANKEGITSHGDVMECSRIAKYLKNTPVHVV